MTSNLLAAFALIIFILGILPALIMVGIGYGVFYLIDKVIE